MTFRIITQSEAAASEIGGGSAFRTFMQGIDLNFRELLDSIASADAYYVRDYGAVVDGTTDDTTAIQDAITDAAADGKIVHLGYGTSIVDELTIPSNTVLVGYGMGRSVLKRKASSTNNSVLELSSVSNVRLRDFTVDGNKANQSTAATNVRVTSSSDTQMIKLELKDAKTHRGTILTTTTDTNSTTRSYIVDSYIHGNDDCGIDCNKSPYWTFANNKLHSNGSDAILCRDYDDLSIPEKFNQLIIVNNEITNQGSENGITCNGFMEGGTLGSATAGPGQPDTINTIIANNIVNGANYGIVFQGNHSIVANNTVRNCTPSAGILVNCAWTNIVGNSILDCGFFGIDAGGAQYCTISNNVFRGGDTSATQLNMGASVRCQVTGNIFDTYDEAMTCIHMPGIDGGDDTHPFPWLGTGTSIVGNTFNGDGSGSSLGIWVRRNYRHCYIADNTFDGFDDVDAIKADVVNGVITNNRVVVSGTYIQTYASASTVVIADHCEMAVISGTTQIDNIRTSSQDFYYQKVMDVHMTNMGSGYSQGTPPTVSFSGGGGSSAAATAVVSNDGKVAGVLMTNNGSGYTSAPSVTFSGGGAAAGTALVGASPAGMRELSLSFTNALTVANSGGNIFLPAPLKTKSSNTKLALRAIGENWAELYRVFEDSGTGSESGGAVTIHAIKGKITTSSLTTGAGGTYDITLTNSYVAATDLVFTSVTYNSATAGAPVIVVCTPASGSVALKIRNVSTAAAFDGTLDVSFVVVKA